MGGGLDFVWKWESMVDVRGLLHWYLVALSDYDNCDEAWRFTGFYGNPETNKCEETWTDG